MKNQYINFLLTIDILSGTNNTAKIFGKNIWKKDLVVLNVKGWIFLNVWGEFRKFLWVANFSQSKVDTKEDSNFGFQLKFKSLTVSTLQMFTGNCRDSTGKSE